MINSALGVESFILYFWSFRSYSRCSFTSIVLGPFALLGLLFWGFFLCCHNSKLNLAPQFSPLSSSSSLFPPPLPGCSPVFPSPSFIFLLPPLNSSFSPYLPLPSTVPCRLAVRSRQRYLHILISISFAVGFLAKGDRIRGFSLLPKPPLPLFRYR